MGMGSSCQYWRAQGCSFSEEGGQGPFFLLRAVQDLRILSVVLRTSKGMSSPQGRKDLLAGKKRIFPYFLFNLLLYYEVQVCYF